MIEMLTVEGEGYTIDVIARITFDGSENKRHGHTPELRAGRKVAEITTAIEDAVEGAV